MAKAMRYGQILGLIEQVKPETIIEIGVWNGVRATEMALAALAHSPRVHYTGYDLFEEATEETNRDELNAKRNCTLADVAARLEAFGRDNPGFSFGLVKGNTRETLKEKHLVADFVYIDGGHSVETIRSDYAAVKDSPVVVFDDYYKPDAEGKGADLAKFGANELIDGIRWSDHDYLEAEVLPSTDPLNVGGTVHLAVVRHFPNEPSEPAVS